MKTDNFAKMKTSVSTKSTPVTSLDGEGWHIATDSSNQGREAKWFAAPRPEAKTVAVPITIQEAFPNYHGLAWYWRSFTVSVNPDPEGRTLLRFWAVGCGGAVHLDRHWW